MPLTLLQFIVSPTVETKTHLFRSFTSRNFTLSVNRRVEAEETNSINPKSHKGTQAKLNAIEVYQRINIHFQSTHIVDSCDADSYFHVVQELLRETRSVRRKWKPWPFRLAGIRGVTLPRSGSVPQAQEASVRTLNLKPAYHVNLTCRSLLLVASQHSLLRLFHPA